MITSFFWNYYLVESSNSKLVINKSRAFFDQILITRVWNAEHGGVYVPITKTTQPNPYLEDSLRDVETIDGLKLTKINPSYMTRQIAEINDTKNDLVFHITSLNPIRPENKADDWETKSLKMFENGISENFELVENDSISQYRYMAPLVVEMSCLKCHAKQGYRYKDIRGGISISFSNKVYAESIDKQIASFVLIHLVILLLGMIGIWFYYRMANKYLLIIENRNNELTQINAAKDKFFSIIGHDLKVPFNSIIGFSELLKEQINKKNYDSSEEYAGIIHDSSKKVSLLLGNLLEWSRTQTREIPFNPKSLDLVKEINVVKELLNETANQKSITIEIEIEETLLVFADKDMINTVLRNLISNAIKFTDTGGRITISAQKVKNYIIVKIADTGIGMPKERLEKLFTLSSNYSTSGTQNEKGTGLGLILCKEFVEKNKGKIWVESILEIGSSFYFSLPTNNE